jgi:uncharacterized protein
MAGPAPLVTYKEGLAAGELRFQRCGGCERAVFYPRVLCPFCGSGELAWAVAAGEGVVYATTAMHRRESEPYNVCLVDLDEGFRMMSRVEGPAAEAVAIGTRVRLRIESGADAAGVDPASGAASDPAPIFVPAEPS